MMYLLAVCMGAAIGAVVMGCFAAHGRQEAEIECEFWHDVATGLAAAMQSGEGAPRSA